LSILWMFSGLIVALFAKKVLLDTNYTTYMLFSIYSFLGVAPLIICAFMLINMMVISDVRDERFVLPITSLNTKSGHVLLANSAKSELDIDHVNPQYIDTFFVNKHQVRVGDSLEVVVKKKEHIPGWITYESVQITGLKHD